MSIKFENVQFVYQPSTPFEFKALNNINLEINKGEFVAIVGHTGSGKSTLVQQINALEKPSQGTVYVDEFKVDNSKKTKDLKKLKKHAGLVFQFPEYQLFEETVIKDVCYGPKNFNLKEEEALLKARKALSLVKIDESLFDKSPFELSGGQKRRCALAGIIALEPKILILDEPTAGLDPQGEKDIMELIKEIHQQDTTIVMVTHNMDLVLKYASRVIVLNQGEIVFDQKPSELFKRDDLYQNYNVVPPLVITWAKDLIKNGININIDNVKDEITLVKEIKRSYE